MSLSRRQSALLLLSLLAVAVGQSLFFAILPPLGREVRLSEWQITSMISASALVFGLCAPWWGRRSDRVGRKPVIITGLLGYCCGTLFFAGLFQAALLGYFTVSLGFYLFLLLARATQSMVMSGTMPGCTAYAADHTGAEQRARAMAKLGAAHNFGMILGPAISGALSAFGLLAPLFFAGLLTAAAAAFVWRKLPATPPAALGSHPAPRRLRYADPRIARFLAAGIGLFTGFAAIQQTLGFLIQDTFGLNGIETAQMTGAAMMISAVFAFGAQLLLVQRLSLTPEQFIRAGLALLCASALAVGGADSYFLLGIGMALMGAGAGLAMPSISAGASIAVAPEEQGAVAGLISSCPAIGFVAGPLLAGWLYQQNPMLPSVFSGIAFAALLAVMMAARGRGDRAKVK